MTRLLLASLLAFWSAAAQATSVTRVEIIEAGTYVVVPIRREADPNAPVGYKTWIADAKLVDATTRICARLNTNFGVRYIVVGDTPGAQVQIDMVTRFPPPGLVSPAGRTFPVSEFTSVATLGEPDLRTFGFDEPWEMAAGTWTLEFYVQGRKVGEQAFSVMTSCETS